MDDRRFTPDEAQAIEDGCRAVFEAAGRARLRWRLDEALLGAMREAEGPLSDADAMVTVLRKWCLGRYPTLPGRPCDREGLKAIRSVLRAYASMEARTWPGAIVQQPGASVPGQLEQRLAQIHRIRAALKDQREAGDAEAIARSLTLLRHAYRQTRQLCIEHAVPLPHGIPEEDAI